MLLGMALYRIGVFSAALTRGTYWSMFIGGLVVGLPMISHWLCTQQPKPTSRSRPGMFLYGQFNYIGSMFVALAWVGLVMLIVKAGALKWLTEPHLAAVGQMALTNYLMQTIICTTIFYGHGFGLFGQIQLSRADLFRAGGVDRGIDLVTPLAQALSIRSLRMALAESDLLASPADETTRRVRLIRTASPQLFHHLSGERNGWAAPLPLGQAYG